MKTRIVRTTITELDETEAYDLTSFLIAVTNKDVNPAPAPTDKQVATAVLFATLLEDTLG